MDDRGGGGGGGDGAPSTTTGRCRGYGRGVSRNASAAGPSGGFIAGSPIDIGSGGGGHAVGSPGCPWVVDALPGQRINFTMMDFFERRRRTTTDGGGDYDNHALRPLGKQHPSRRQMADF